MVTVGKVWQVDCEMCKRAFQNQDSFVEAVAIGVMRGWLFQYQEFAHTPRYNWAAYCPDHRLDAPTRLIPDDLRCGVSRMRRAVTRSLRGSDPAFIAERVR